MKKVKSLLFLLLISKFIYAQSGEVFSVGSEYDLIYHRLELELDPAVNFISGNITTYFKPVKDKTTSISFDLADKMKVDFVSYHGKKLKFTHTNNVLNIELPKNLKKDLLDSISVVYSGKPASQRGFGSFSISHHKSVPVMWTLSAPYGARDWWACKQSLYDKADSIDVVVTHPSKYKVASNGLLMSEKQHENKTITHWKHRYPITEYLIAFAITNYRVYNDYVLINDKDTLVVTNYVYPENKSAEQQTPEIADIMQLYNKLFIEYPFKKEKYGHAQFNWGGGMEHQTMSFMWSFNFGLMAHELAHQWFGNYITCGSWKDIWLNESFATYCEYLNYENGLGKKSALNWKRNKIGYITARTGGSVYVDDTVSVNRIFDARLTYDKGAMVLNMLRHEIGDTAFFGGIKNYLTDEKLINGFAYTSDFKRNMEKAAGRNLDYFFNDWIYGQGFPMYSIIWTQNDKNDLYLKISQKQSHGSVKFFELKVPLRFVGEGRDTVLIFNNTKNDEEFTRELDFKVSSIYFDPHKNLISARPHIRTNKSDKKSGITILPNPVNSEMRILIENDKVLKVVNIHDITGKIVKSLSLEQDNRDIRIDVKDLRKGLYFVVLKGKNAVFIEKILKN